MEFTSEIGKRKDLMVMLGMNETIDQFVMANSVCRYGNVLRREDGHLRAWCLKVKGRKHEGWSEQRRYSLPVNMDCWH